MAPDQSRPVTQPLKQLGGVCVCVWDDLQALLNLLMCACHVRVACVCVCGGGGCRCSSTCSCRPPSTPSPSSSATTPLPSRPRPRTPRRLTPQHPAGGALSESTSRLGVYVETRKGFLGLPESIPHPVAAHESPSPRLRGGCGERKPIVLDPDTRRHRPLHWRDPESRPRRIRVVLARS